jgi:uncharacterized repeat protein (TIGR03843 family)
VLAEGTLEVVGRILPASNVTLLAEVRLAGESVRCVYKPVAGERPLWDFPDGSLAARERAAYVVSELLGWDVVPLTVLRDGPAGRGMVQVWCEPDPDQDPVDVVPAHRPVPDGFLHVLDATDQRDRPVSLVHEDGPALRRMAVFDVLVNNADRKGGHVLAMPDGHRYGVDHGVCFHVEHKLRTVLWGWADDRLDPADAEAVERLLDELTGGCAPGPDELAALLTPGELAALERRTTRLLARRRMPNAGGHWPSIPWPAF